MPEVSTTTETFNRELLSAPPDGFVDLRKLTYGERLHVRGLAARFELSTREKSDPNDTEEEDTTATTAVDLEGSIFYQFKKSIVGHNLTILGKKLNFNDRRQFVGLNSEVGAEIEKYIAILNGEDEDEPIEGEALAAKSDSKGNPLASASIEPSKQEASG